MRISDSGTKLQITAGELVTVLIPLQGGNPIGRSSMGAVNLDFASIIRIDLFVQRIRCCISPSGTNLIKTLVCKTVCFFHQI